MHIATINAFKNKFGTYTGAIRDERTKEVVRERFDTLDAARHCGAPPSPSNKIGQDNG